MSLYISSLNSGSNGNCYYIGNDTEAVLVDVGISCREVERRMSRSGLALKKIKAVFISHEHIDHIRGVEVFSKKHQIPVYISSKIQTYSRLNLVSELTHTFYHNVPVSIGSLSVLPFSKLHDAIDPFSFTIESNGIKIGVFTDIGRSCENLINAFKNCHAAFLEANYDTTLLETGRYPFHLKKRIKGGKGHLSNDQALELFVKYKSPALSHLFLSHLSKENNCPILAKELFTKVSGSTQIIVASRYEETAVFPILNNLEHLSPQACKPTAAVQMSLF